MLHENRSVFSGLLVIILAVLVMIMAASTFFNAMCQSTFDTNLPLYPNAQVVDQRFPFLGDKWMQLYIPVNSTDVRTWYNRATYSAKIDDDLNGTNTAWRGTVSIAPAGDGVGTTVFLLVSCQ